MTIPNYSYDFTSKRRNISVLNDYMLTKTLSMFEYENLPESIPYREMEKQLQKNGYTFITKYKGELYAMQGGLGGIPDVYGQPTQIVIANPALNWNATLDIEKDGVLVRNDDLMVGVMPLYERFNTLLVENDINILLHGYATRMKTLISASDDKTKESADEYMKQVIDGKPAVIGESALFDGIKVHSGAESGGGAMSLIEMTQYLKASLMGEVGISTNFNMKKERLITDEIEQQQDGSFPYVYSMMKCRLTAIEKINEMFDTEISVDFGSVWNIQNRRFVDDIIDEDLADENNPNEFDIDDTGDGEYADISDIEDDIDLSEQIEVEDVDLSVEPQEESIEIAEEAVDDSVENIDLSAEPEEADIDLSEQPETEDTPVEQEPVEVVIVDNVDTDEVDANVIDDVVEEVIEDEVTDEIVIDTPDDETSIVVVEVAPEEEVIVTDINSNEDEEKEDEDES